MRPQSASRGDAPGLHPEEPAGQRLEIPQPGLIPIFTSRFKTSPEMRSMAASRLNPALTY